MFTNKYPNVNFGFLKPANEEQQINVVYYKYASHHMASLFAMLNLRLLAIYLFITLLTCQRCPSLQPRSFLLSHHELVIFLKI